MPDYVRVAVNGYKRTVSRGYADNAGLSALDEPATDAFGRPLAQTRENGRRAKPRTTVEREAAKRTTTRRTTKKTTARKRAAKKSTSGGASASTTEE